MATATRLRTWSRSRGNRLPSSVYTTSHPVHVTICTWREVPHFERTVLAAAVFRNLVAHPGTLAACLMPDHLHWLIADGTGLPVTVGRFKSFTSKLARDRGLRGHLWQRSYWDHVVRRAEGVEVVAKYIVDNPVRAGLVTEAADYPFQMVRLPGE